MRYLFTASIWLFTLVAASTLAQAETQTIVNYNPQAPISNFNAPFPTNNQVQYTITFGSDSTSIFGTIQADPAGKGNDSYTGGLNFANLYFGTGSSYMGADFGIEVENNLAFIPGGAKGPADLNTYGFTTTTTAGTDYDHGGLPTIITFSLPWSYLMTDPDNLGFSKVTSANPYAELRDSQSLSYTYVGGSTFGDTRFGLETYSPSDVPEPATWASLLGGGAMLAGFAIRKRLALRG